jgi:DNA polymerase-3 subunit alpha/error-prone DNA polymerase
MWNSNTARYSEVGKGFLVYPRRTRCAGKIQLHDTNSVVALVQKYGMMLEKYPNQRSMHSCGILISEEPITNYTVLEMPPKGFSPCIV